jgi:hypothetical protein
VGPARVGPEDPPPSPGSWWHGPCMSLIQEEKITAGTGCRLPECHGQREGMAVTLWCRSMSWCIRPFGRSQPVVSSESVGNDGCMEGVASCFVPIQKLGAALPLFVGSFGLRGEFVSSRPQPASPSLRPSSPQCSSRSPEWGPDDVVDRPDLGSVGRLMARQHRAPALDRVPPGSRGHLADNAGGHLSVSVTVSFLWGFLSPCCYSLVPSLR